MLAAVAVALSFLPSPLGDPIHTDRVDVIEINHCFQVCDGQPRLRFTQVIFWRHRPTVGPRGPALRLRVAAWRMADTVTVSHDAVQWRATAPGYAA